MHSNKVNVCELIQTNNFGPVKGKEKEIRLTLNKANPRQILTRNSSRMKNLALVTFGSSPGSGVAAEKKM